MTAPQARPMETALVANLQSPYKTDCCADIASEQAVAGKLHSIDQHHDAK
jgi:hypothetical protein